MAADILSYSFMQHAFLGGALVAIICASLGVFLVLKRLSLLGDGLSHVAFAGVALGLLMGVDPVLTAFLLTTIGALGVQETISRTKVYGETATAIVLSVGLGIAVLLIGLAHGFNVDILSYLFGSILALNNFDLELMGLVLLSTILTLFVFYKKMVFVAFNSELARVSGVNTKLVERVFIILIAMAVVVGMRAVGILLISALFVMPAVTAFQISRSFKKALFIAVVVAVLGVELGIVISFYLDLPPSAVIVILLLMSFVLAVWTRRLSEAKKNKHRWYAKKEIKI